MRFLVEQAGIRAAQARRSKFPARILGNRWFSDSRFTGEARIRPLRRNRGMAPRTLRKNEGDNCELKDRFPYLPRAAAMNGPRLKALFSHCAVSPKLKLRL